MGSDYQSEPEEFDEDEEEEEGPGEPEEGSQLLTPDEDAPENPRQMVEITEKAKEEEEESRQDIPAFVEEPFCPLKYLAEALRRAKNELKDPKQSKEGKAS